MSDSELVGTRKPHCGRDAVLCSDFLSDANYQPKVSLPPSKLVRSMRGFVSGGRYLIQMRGKTNARRNRMAGSVPSVIRGTPKKATRNPLFRADPLLECSAKLSEPRSRKIYEARRRRNLDAQNSRTVPSRITAPGSGTEDTLPSTLNETALPESVNTWSSVNE